MVLSSRVGPLLEYARMCKVMICPSGSHNDKAIGTNEVERAKRSRFMQDIRRKLGDSLRVASGQIDTSLDPIPKILCGPRSGIILLGNLWNRVN